MELKIQLSQRAPARWRPAWSAAAWFRVILLSLVCACAGLICSSTVASADTRHKSGAPLATGAQVLGRTLTGTGKGLLGGRGQHRPTAARPAHNHPAAKAAQGGATARADEPVTSPPSSKRHLAIKQPEIKPRALIKHRLIKQPEIKQPHITHRHRSKPVIPADDGAGTVIDNVTSTARTAIRSTSGRVHGISSRVGSTADPGERARTVGVLGGDRSGPAGNIVDGVGDTVTDLGGTVDSLGQAADDLDTSVASTARGTVTRTINLTVETTIGDTTGTFTETITSTVTGAAAETVTGIGGVVGATVAGIGGVVGATVADGVEPIASAPQLDLFMTDPAGGASPEHAAGSSTRAQPATESGFLLKGPGGGPVPGQLPQPTGEMITASSSGGT